MKLITRDEFISTCVYYWKNKEEMPQEDLKLAKQEEREILKKVPKNFVVVSSESDGEENEAWDALAEFFGNKIYNSYVPKITPLKKKGFVAYTSGEMTWSVFIHPKTLGKILTTAKQQ